MRKIIEQDICAKCSNVSLMEPIPQNAVQWEVKAICAAGWRGRRICLQANAVSECVNYSAGLAGESEHG